MRVLRLLLCIVFIGLMLVPAVTLAVEPPADPGEAVLCFFTDWNASDGPAGGDIQYEGLQTYHPYPFYIVLYHPRGLTETLGGFEFSLRLDNAGQELLQDEDVYLVDEDWCPDQGGIVNYGLGSFNYLAGILQPWRHDGNPVLILACEIMFTNLHSNTYVNVFCDEATPPSIPGQMTYADQRWPEILLRMVPNSADFDLANPVFSWAGAVSVESRTWTDVKTLYTD